MSIMLMRDPIHQTCLKHDQLRTFDLVWLKKFTKEVGKFQLSKIDRIKLKLKEVDLNFLQSLMKGVSEKLKSIADNGVFSYKK